MWSTPDTTALEKLRDEVDALRKRIDEAFQQPDIAVGKCYRVTRGENVGFNHFDEGDMVKATAAPFYDLNDGWLCKCERIDGLLQSVPAAQLTPIRY